MKLIRVKKKDAFWSGLGIKANGVTWEWSTTNVLPEYQCKDTYGTWFIFGSNEFDNVLLDPAGYPFSKYYGKGATLTKDTTNEALNKAQKAGDQEAIAYFTKVTKQFDKMEKSLASVKKIYSKGYIDA